MKSVAWHDDMDSTNTYRSGRERVRLNPRPTAQGLEDTLSEEGVWGSLEARKRDDEVRERISMYLKLLRGVGVIKLDSSLNIPPVPHTSDQEWDPEDAKYLAESFFGMDDSINSHSYLVPLLPLQIPIKPSFPTSFVLRNGRYNLEEDGTLVLPQDKLLMLRIFEVDEKDVFYGRLEEEESDEAKAQAKRVQMLVSVIVFNCGIKKRTGFEIITLILSGICITCVFVELTIANSSSSLSRNE